MNVELKRVTINDIDEIIKMQKESFKALLDRYIGFMKNALKQLKILNF